ncbi:Hypothetical_protein [Hexamita inflata]|uniref:Hypothetical_protein n=1 Tax=Hexamita inflata TaxID=28002 RepID=A0AA86NV13_9EUKA|nr:Hypothetical protein HINF_LOCUS12911 [Hexamita inflata]
MRKFVMCQKQVPKPLQQINSSKLQVIQSYKSIEHNQTADFHYANSFQPVKLDMNNIHKEIKELSTKVKFIDFFIENKLEVNINKLLSNQKQIINFIKLKKLKNK